MHHFVNSATVATFSIGLEKVGDAHARNALLDAAMTANWRRKSSNALRRGYLPSAGLALIARDRDGTVIGTVRLWDIAAGTSDIGVEIPALLLGPLAVNPAIKSSGIGSALMHVAIERAKLLGHGAIVLVGDPEYYKRFGFSSQKTAALAMPGPFETHRLLALELKENALDHARGLITPTGRKLHRAQKIQKIRAA